MSYSDEYVYSLFKKTYQQAVLAKNEGNYALAEKKFNESADYLTRYSALSKGDGAREAKIQADRIRAIAKNVGSKAERPKARPFARDSVAQSGSFSDSEGSSDIFSDEDKDVRGFIEFYSKDDLKGGFESVIGLEEAKNAVTEYVVNPIKYARYYNYDFADNKAVLLEGPPGTGKTTFAKAVAKEIDQPFVLVNVASLVNCYVGETAKNIDKVFAWLRSYTEKNDCGITVFFDEFDEIAKKRGGDDKASASSVPALLRNLDGVKGNKSFLILANTNCMDMLDDGILDRFRKRIHIPLPNEKMRETFFRNKLAEIEDEYKENLDFPGFSKASDGFSGRTVTYVCDDFKYYVGGVKAGIKDGSDLNSVMYSLIDERKKRRSD